MTETTQLNTNEQNRKNISVFIDGDKSAFVSKSAVDKFKQSVKSNPTFNLVELVSKYVKSDYNIELVSSENMEWKFKISKKPVEKTSQPKTEKEQRRELLKARINMMANARTNRDLHKAKSSGNVDKEILTEYQKLLKITKMPIPEPSEILAKPEEYKPIISAVLGNPMMKQQKSHPYVKYFSLLAEKLGVSALPVPIQDLSSTQAGLEQMMKSAGTSKLKQVSGNSLEVIKEDEDTDDEDEADNINV